MATNLDLFAVNVVEEGSPEWINQEWDRMERENPTQTIRMNGSTPIPRAKIITDHSILQRLLRLEAEMKRKRTQTRGEELE